LSFDRYPGVTEGVLADQFRNIGMSTSDLLQLLLHHAHLAGVLQESLGAGVAADDALAAGGERDLAPRPPGRARQRYVDEGAAATHRAPAADGVLAGGARVFQRLDRVETPEARSFTVARPVESAERRADRAGLAGVRVDHDPGAGNLAAH